MDTTGKDIFVEGTEKRMSFNSYIKETITMLHSRHANNGQKAWTQRRVLDIHH
jgi:hypothetical protein